jgi:caa(3)-type oxidase subunit IV
MPKITFEKERVQVVAPMHSNLREIAVANKIPIYAGMAQVANCRGNGQCGTCRVELNGENIKPRNAVEEAKLKGADAKLRLACQIEVLGDMVVKTQGPEAMQTVPGMEPALAGAAGGAHAAAHAHAEHPPVPYFAIAAVLFVMTVITIAVSFVNLGKAGNVILALAVASFKASLVMLFFMHLKYEKKILVVIALTPFVLAAILAFALFPDIVFGR